MAKGLIRVGFYDKNTGIYHAPGKTVEFSDVRLKELVTLGYVESREKPEVKTEEAPEVKPEVKKTAPKKTVKKK